VAKLSSKRWAATCRDVTESCLNPPVPPITSISLFVWATALEEFIVLAERWIQTFPQLVSAGDQENGALSPAGNFSGLRG
jgi:hypothetical protein